MTALVVACGGFLLAVLWFDLIFDVQTLRHPPTGDLPEPVLASIAGYYRRVTTTASPMGHAVGVVMVIAAIGVVVQLLRGTEPRWVPLLSLALGAVPMGLALARVVPNAVRLGARTDPVAEQSRLARAICRDHLFCLVAVAGFLGVQLWAAAG